MRFNLPEFTSIELVNNSKEVYIIIQVDEQGWIYNNWIGKLTDEDVIEGSTMVLEALRKSCSEKILNDNRLVTGSWEGVNTWIDEQWTPNAIRLGLKYFAHVVSPESYAALSAEHLRHRVVGKIEMQLFADIDKAKNWLLTAGSPKNN